MFRVNQTDIKTLNTPYSVEQISELFDGKRSVAVENVAQWEIPIEDKMWILIQSLDVLYKKMFMTDCIESVRHLVVDFSTASVLNSTYLYIFRHISDDQFNSLIHAATVSNKSNPNPVTGFVLRVAHLISSFSKGITANIHTFKETLRVMDLRVLEVANEVCNICNNRYIHTPVCSLQYKPDIKEKIQFAQLARLVEWCTEPHRLYDDRKRLTQTFI